MPRIARSPDAVNALVAALPGLGRVPTPAEERAYAARIAAGGPDGAAAREEFFGRTVLLAVQVVRACGRRPAYAGCPAPELMSAAAEALLTAIDRYDPARGTRFSTHAVPWVRWAVRREAAAQAGRGGGAAPAEEWFPDARPGPAELAERSDDLRHLPGWLAQLGRRDSRLPRVLVLRHGLDGGGPRTLEEAGRLLGGVTKERARQLEAEALQGLREIAGATPPRTQPDRRGVQSQREG